MRTMFTKGQVVRHVRTKQQMRIQRDQREGMRTIWCEWEQGAYHLEAFDESEIELLPQSQQSGP